MRSFFGPLTLTVTLLLSACGGGGGGEDGGNAGESARENYAPMAVGDRWVYSTPTNQGPTPGSEEKIVRISGTTTLNGVTVAIADTHVPADFDLIERRYLRATNTLLEEHFHPSSPLPGQGISSVPLLHFPLASGNSFVAYDWQGLDIIGDFDNDGVNDTFDDKRIVTVIDKEALTTPLGEFPAAWKVTSLRTSRVNFSQGGKTDISERVDEWLANKIGVVRRVITTTYSWNGGESYSSQKSYDLLRYNVGGHRSEEQAPQVQEQMLSPARDSTINDAWVQVRVPFDETIDVSALTEGSLVVTNANGETMPGTLSFNDRELLFRPSAPLQDGSYTVHANGIPDAIGNLLDQYQWTFTVDTSTATDPQNLVPLAVGNRWIYDITTRENTGDVLESQRMETVTGTTTVQGRQGLVIQVRDTLTNELDREFYLEKNATGLSQLFAPGTAPYQLNVPAIPLLHFPIYADTYENGRWAGLDAGRDYDGDGVTDTMEVTLTTTIGNYPEYISVPAGAWSTAVRTTTVQRIVITGSAAGGQAKINYTTIEWLVSGIGAVQRVTETSTTGYNHKITQHLSAYHVGTLRSESIPPWLTARTPSPYGVNVAPTEILLEFSETLDTNALPTPALTVTNSAGQSVQGTLQTSNTQLRFVPASPLPDDRYHVTVANVTDLLGNALTGLSWDFTVDTIRPHVLLSSLASGATNVATRTVITLSMNEPVLVGSFNSPLITLTTSDGASVYNSPQMNGSTLTITPALLQHDTTYTLTVTNAVSDPYGNTLATPWTLTFSTPPAQLETPQQIHETWGSIAASAIGDVNDDGRKDLVIATGLSQSLNNIDQYTLFVFLQRADGTLDTPLKTVTYDGPPYGLVCSPYSLAIGDVTGDGNTDIVLGEGYCGLSIYQRALDGSWPRPASRISSSDGLRVRTGDMNNDGRLDVVGRGNGTISVWYQLSGGGLSAAYTTSSGIGHGALELADLNGDGLLDLALTKEASASTDSDTLAVVTQNGSGAFNAPVAYRTGSWMQTMWRMAVGDVTGDSRADLLFSMSSNSIGPHIGVFPQQANGTLGELAFTPTNVHPMTVFVADLNQDGRNDVLSGTDSTTSILLQGDNGTLGTEDRYGGGNLLVVGDLNGDGYPDVVSSQYRKLYVTYNVGP